MLLTALDADRGPDSVSQDLCRGSSGLEPRKQATAEEGTLQGTVAVHSASAKTGCFADRIQARDDVTVEAEHPPVQIGFETAESLTCQNM